MFGRVDMNCYLNNCDVGRNGQEELFLFFGNKIWITAAELSGTFNGFFLFLINIPVTCMWHAFLL